MAEHDRQTAPRHRSDTGVAARLAVGMLCVVLGVCASACTAHATRTSGSTGRSAGATTTSGKTATGDRLLIERRIAALNKTAGGPVATQRAALQKAVVPGEAGNQRECPTATQTLDFQPVYSSLRRVTPATSNGPAPDGGRGYLLPALIHIYLGDRIVGTDMTTLRMWIIDGSARTAVMCVA